MANTDQSQTQPAQTAVPQPQTDPAATQADQVVDQSAVATSVVPEPSAATLPSTDTSEEEAVISAEVAAQPVAELSAPAEPIAIAADPAPDQAAAPAASTPPAPTPEPQPTDEPAATTTDTAAQATQATPASGQAPMPPSDNRKYDEVIDHLVDTDGGLDVGTLLEQIVKKALEEKSSDIHIEPREDDVVVRFRVDGLLREVMTIDKKLEQALVFKIKVASRLRTDEHFAPQDGKIRFLFEDLKVDTRVSILPTTKGEKVVFRLLTQQGKAFGLEDLGVVGRDLELVQKSFTKPYGMIIAAGPTGSGKTTTLYSILKILNDPEINITTIEDPVEYDIDGINHVQVNSKANMTFATGLRSLLRQDPDVLMIGEIRDGETARIAINSAMTGHLVLSTIHTNDAITTVPRLVDMGIEPYLVASTINVVIAQRLARKLCESCRAQTTMSPEEHAELAKIRPDIAALIKPGEPHFKAGSCAACGGVGYKGRIGLYEILEMNKPVRDQVNSGASADEIFKTARESGLTLIVEDGIKKVKLGIISIDELQRVTAIREE
ncbi:MAG: GspE/PulE family protein [Candidatus Dojkabacteria bacterium]|nr:MAG: GspE/PulE family protein [Candidatus Dojkabacteria bacterium]